MHRRDFFKTILTTPLLTPLFLASKKSKNDWELYFISDNPQKYIPAILEDLQKHTPLAGRKYTFLNSFPREESLAAALLRQGWIQGLSPKETDMTLSFSFLRHKASPSFTLVREGRIQDIRSQKLLALWKEINRNTNPSSTLTIISFKNRPHEHQNGHFIGLYKNGQKIERLPLGKNLSRTYQTKKGPITTRIKNGKAWVSDSSCAHQICCYSPPVSLAGERIICAPNHFYLEVLGNSGVDTIIG